MCYMSSNTLNFFIYLGNVKSTFIFLSECMNTEVNASNGEQAAKLFVLKIICTSRSV